jgi:hypothetical protein
MPLPKSRDRVPDSTSRGVNLDLEAEIAARLLRAAALPEFISSRIKELDEEWDIERAIELNAAALAFVGTVLGYFLHPYWLALPALVTAFLFQHALQGWCPPVPILRRLGFRTAYEIERERHSLKAMRGDYDIMRAADDKVSAARTAVAA